MTIKRLKKKERKGRVGIEPWTPDCGVSALPLLPPRLLTNSGIWLLLDIPFHSFWWSKPLEITGTGIFDRNFGKSLLQDFPFKNVSFCQKLGLRCNIYRSEIRPTVKALTATCNNQQCIAPRPACLMNYRFLKARPSFTFLSLD